MAVLNFLVMEEFDLSFDLISDFKSSFLAFSFRSKKRYGYVTGWNKLLLNEKLEKVPHRDLSVRGLELLNTLEPDLDLSTFEVGPKKIDLDQTEEEEGAKVIPLFKEKKESFIFVSISNLLEEKSKDIWVEFFNLFDSQKFIFLQDEKCNLKKYFLPLLNEKNEYFVQSLKLNGYRGISDEEVVDKWFQDLCLNVAKDSGQAEDIGGSGHVNRVLRDDGKTEVS